MFSASFTLFTVLQLFLYQSPLSLSTVFDVISSNLSDFLSINPCTSVFVFGEPNVHHKDRLTYSNGTDRPGKLCCNFSISNYFTQMINFSTWIPDCDCHSPALLDCFLSSGDSICSSMALLPLGISDHVVVSVFNNFSSDKKHDAPFNRIA